ncbi:probable phosphoglycerate mutase [Paenibacillus sp. UNCCL117]|uniref:histidine phosphatase family protein n=1 Tax=unclassified Paenibacillus TaxID=185978 RepID=UPI000886A99D|nr:MULTISPECIES: histidine phosphatase family protein [unclassified Paenibacillus]SDE43830.1 probable phosphoglycerate mutase [Paenibacillus sp. cl123]SFW46087.1 probable phosphoglycerate mutase [Paenibacillus sp. UNCCL117]
MDNKTTIYLVRHGQTEWNVHHRMQGHQDSPLTELGIRQAEWLSEAIFNEAIDVIYSSSSPRAQKTAEIIRNTRNIRMFESDDLREINLGIWEGKTQSEVKELFPEEFRNFWEDPGKFWVEGSETFEEVATRSIGACKRIAETHAGKTILIVTHTVVVKLLMAYFENRPLKDIWNPPYIHPACLSKVVLHNDEMEIMMHGDTTHFKEKPVEG